MSAHKDTRIVVEDDVNSTAMAFTVQFDDPKPDGRKLKIHDKLSSFASKHRRNPSLPDFKAVRATRSLESPEGTPLSAINVSKIGKQLNTSKVGYHSEGYFSSDQDEESIKQRNRNTIVRSKISPVTEDKPFVSQINGASATYKLKNISSLRRNSMNDLDTKNALKSKAKFDATFTKESEMYQGEVDDKSDTVSEAGTYTVDKDEISEGKENQSCQNEVPEQDAMEGNDDNFRRKSLTAENHKWINDWVKKVAEESFPSPDQNSTEKEKGVNAAPSISGSSSPSASMIPSPVNTLPKMRDSARRERSTTQPKANGVHRRSSSLSAKDFSENRTSDSSLETESYLRTTESVMAAMQSRMKLNLKLNLTDANSKKQVTRKERLHPPSTASDTDTNSENESKVFKKPLGTPFTSARLNRAFSLRRARTDHEAENNTPKKQTPVAATPTTRSTPSPQSMKPKAASVSPFARTDCGRFSMRSLPSASKSSNTPAVVLPKKEPRKPPGGGRSNSSLSSREVEFQNWKRRKSFDPMKAAAEGRKKEAAKKAALSHSITSPTAMTQSVNLGTTIQPRSGNPVLRSASFHSSLHPSGPPLDLEDELSPEEDGSVESSDFINQPVLPPNSPTKPVPIKASLVLRAGVGGSRGSLNSAISETHSSPSHRARSELIDNLLVSAISDISVKLKVKSSHLLKRLESCCEDDRLVQLRGELSGAESQRGSANSSPARKNPRDFPIILKNLKSIECVLQLLDDILFGDDPIDDD